MHITQETRQHACEGLLHFVGTQRHTAAVFQTLSNALVLAHSNTLTLVVLGFLNAGAILLP